MKRFSLHTGTLFAASVGFGVLLSLASFKFQVSISNQISSWNPVDHANLYKQWLVSKAVNNNKQTEAEYLRKTVKVLCMVMIDLHPGYNAWRISEAPNLDPPEKVIAATWGKRCTNALYFSGKTLSVPSIHLNTTSRTKKWKAIREAITYVSKHHTQEDYNWYLLVEEDTFVIYENLLYYLSVYDARKLHYFGHTLVSWGSEHIAIGPGAVLSYGAYKKLQGALLKGHCPASSANGEWELGRCLSDVGCNVQDTRDHLGRARFLMYQPEALLIPKSIPWTSSFWTNSKYNSKEAKCTIICSSSASSFFKLTNP